MRKETEAIESVGKKLREIRISKGISLRKLSILADMEYSQLSRIERGKINTSIAQLVGISRILEIHPKDLFNFEI